MAIKNKDDRDTFFSDLDGEAMRDALYGHEINDYSAENSLLGNERLTYKKKKKKPRRER